MLHDLMTREPQMRWGWLFVAFVLAGVAAVAWSSRRTNPVLYLAAIPAWLGAAWAATIVICDGLVFLHGLRSLVFVGVLVGFVMLRHSASLSR